MGRPGEEEARAAFQAAHPKRARHDQLRRRVHASGPDRLPCHCPGRAQLREPLSRVLLRRAVDSIQLKCAHYRYGPQ